MDTLFSWIISSTLMCSSQGQRFVIEGWCRSTNGLRQFKSGERYPRFHGQYHSVSFLIEMGGLLFWLFVAEVRAYIGFSGPGAAGRKRGLQCSGGYLFAWNGVFDHIPI
jgi:hypothetical protein